MSTWILVADSSRATMMTAEFREDAWTLVKHFDNPDGRKTSHDIAPSSPPGRMQESKALGARRSSMEPHTTPKEAAGEDFAHELAAFIEEAQNSSKFDAIVLAAPPHFLGLLRGLLAEPLGKRLRASVDKDLTKLDASAIRAHLLDAAFPSK
jgi:protein required for attachment to host cells